MIIFLNGAYIPEEAAKISVFDQGFLYGDGVYETMRTYKGRLWKPDLHMRRLEKSMRAAGLVLPYTYARLIDQVKTLIKKNGYKEARVRVMITRGVSTTKGARFSPNLKGRVTVCITCYALPLFTGKVKLPEVSAAFFPVERAFPTVKTTSMFPLVMARMHALQQGLFDVLLVDREGYVSEGAVSNLFVMRKGVLYTPKAGVLLGVTRDTILKLGRALVRKKILKKIVYGYFKKSFVKTADEVFLTNAPSGVVAVTTIGGKAIGNGKAGTVTKAVFQALVDSL